MKQAAHISMNADAIGEGFTRIDMASVFCIGCHAPGDIDGEQLCFHCRRVPRSQRMDRQNESQRLLMLIFWLAIAAACGVAWLNGGSR